MPPRSTTFRSAAGLVVLAALLCGCSHAGALTGQGETAATGSIAAAAAPAATASAASAPPMTREQASTDCWMKYEGRGLSLDQRLPLVEKCTAEKLKQAAR
ncbi:MAG TPA: hypothetical protein VFA53_11900 [Xanthobacteraceae bacterium]|nr:hypothetical protein [Xanthobacteraceae bacterium]